MRASLVTLGPFALSEAVTSVLVALAHAEKVSQPTSKAGFSVKMAGERVAVSMRPKVWFIASKAGKHTG